MARLKKALRETLKVKRKSEQVDTEALSKAYTSLQGAIRNIEDAIPLIHGSGHRKGDTIYRQLDQMTRTIDRLATVIKP